MRRVGVGPSSPGRPRRRQRLSGFGIRRLYDWRGLRGARLPDALDELDAVVLEDALRAADRVALAIEQMADAAQKVDGVGSVIAAAARALQRPDLVEAGFPESQHVLRQVEIVRDFTD